MAARGGNSDAVLLAMLGSGATYAAAAEAASVSVRTVERRMAEAGFRRELRARQEHSLVAAMAAISDGATKAIELLVATLDDDDVPASIKVTAARALVGAVLKHPLLSVPDEPSDRREEPVDRLVEMERMIMQLDAHEERSAG